MSELKAYIAYEADDFPDETEFYLKSEADKVIEKLKTMAKEYSIPNRTFRKCGRVGTLMYMSIVKDGRIYWNLYNNKGIDYVFGIRCAHCGEVAFVTKQTHEYELRRQKYKRCLAMAKWSASECVVNQNIYKSFLTRKSKFRIGHFRKWHKRWLAIAEKFKEAM